MLNQTGFRSFGATAEGTFRGKDRKMPPNNRDNIIFPGFREQGFGNFAKRSAPKINSSSDTPPLLAKDPRILERMVTDLARAGLVGEARAAKLVYLLLTSRFPDRPLCAVIKGQSSAGKSYLVERVMALFPEDAYHFTTSISPKALAYGSEPLKHRILVIAEADGFRKGADALMLRSLISEGRIHRETVDKDGKSLTLDKEGPTGLLVTTTAHQLEPELETRMFSIPINDSPEQTAAIMMALAQRSEGSTDVAPIDPASWHELQKWLKNAEHRVVIPYAPRLAKLIPSSAVRLRRDFGAVLRMIKTHALLHQLQREHDSEGRIVATSDDYAAIYDLVVALVKEGVGASVPPEVRETVNAVRDLKQKHLCGVPQYALVTHLKRDKGTVSRRVADAE
jgi:hypothetical protein